VTWTENHHTSYAWVVETYHPWAKVLVGVVISRLGSVVVHDEVGVIHQSTSSLDGVVMHVVQVVNPVV
jgi:hypothetical protein